MSEQSPKISKTVLLHGNFQMLNEPTDNQVLAVLKKYLNVAIKHRDNLASIKSLETISFTVNNQPYAQEVENTRHDIACLEKAIYDRTWRPLE